MTLVLPQIPLSLLERFSGLFAPPASGSLLPEEPFLRVEVERSLPFPFWEEWPMDLLRVR